MLPWSDLGRPLTLRNRRDGDEGEAASLHRPFDNPHDAVREHGTYGGQGKAVKRGSADGFAVCENGLSVFDVDQRRRVRCCCWIMSRVLQQWTRSFFSTEDLGHQTLVAFSFP